MIRICENSALNTRFVFPDPLWAKDFGRIDELVFSVFSYESAHYLIRTPKLVARCPSSSKATGPVNWIHCQVQIKNKTKSVSSVNLLKRIFLPSSLKASNSEFQRAHSTSSIDDRVSRQKQMMKLLLTA